MLKRLTALILALMIAFAVIGACAEEFTLWVMCKPNNYVNIRYTPTKNGQISGYLDSCDSFTTDGTRKNGFISVLDAGEGGWVSERYVVDEKPDLVNEYYICVATKQAACRQWINGPRIKGKLGWMKNGVRVKVYLITSEWALTARGYIKSEWLEVDP